MPLDTLANVKAALLITGADDDAVLARLMDAAESFVAEHCGRAFAGGTFTETHPGGGDALFLRNFPVATVTAVEVDAARQFGPDTALDPTAYFVHADRGVVVSTDGAFLPSRSGRRGDDSPGTVRVTYTTATGAVPGAVTEAFTQLVVHWYKAAKTNAEMGFGNAVQVTDSSGGVRLYSYSAASGGRLPPTVLALLAAFRVPTV